VLGSKKKSFRPTFQFIYSGCSAAIKPLALRVLTDNALFQIWLAGLTKVKWVLARVMPVYTNSLVKTGDISCGNTSTVWANSEPCDLCTVMA